MQWVNVMVSSWVCAVNGGRCAVDTVIFNDCRSATVGANVGGIVFVRRWSLNFLGVPYDDRFVINNEGNNWRSRMNAWCWWREQCNFAKSEGAEGLDSLYFVRRCFLDACNGGGESCCSVNDSIGGFFFWDRGGMVFEPEPVGDRLTACVGHENPNTLIVISIM